MPGCLAGSVHSVFKNAVNISTSAGLISVADVKYLNGPGRVLVKSPDFTKYVAAGEKVEFSEKRILLGGRLEIDLKETRPWHPSVKNITAGIPDISCLLKKAGGSYFVKPQLVDALKTGVTERDKSLIQYSADSLTGLGAGLTPAGDDVLSGFISAGHYFSGCGRFDFFLKNVKINFDKTNSISAQYLKHALEGRISELISNVIISAADGSRELEAWADKLLGIGATSGRDILLGLVSAMEVHNACKFD